MKILTWFDNIKLPVKMGIIAILAVAGLGLPTYYYSQLSFDTQSSSEIELKGIAPVSAVVKLKKAVAEHRGISAALFGGDTSVSASLSAKANEIDQAMRNVRSALTAATDSSGILQSLTGVEQDWANVKSSVSSRQLSALDSFAIHSALMSDADLLISELSKHFLLSYDPAAASYHLIIANFQNLPRLADNLGKIRGAGAGILSGDAITESQKSSIRAYLNNIQSPLTDFEYNMLSASEADPRFQSAYQKATTLKGKVEELERLTDQQIISRTDSAYSGTEYFNQYSAVINELYGLFDQNVLSLTTVIEERTESIADERLTTLTIIVSLLALSLTTGAIIVRSVVSSARTLISAFKHISEGDYKVELNQSRKDEMGVLEQELTVLAQQLEGAALVAVEASKVKQALDSSTMAFMMSDSDRTIVYMNEASRKLLKDCEAEIRRDLPQFNADKLIGSSIDSFHKKPAHQHAVLDKLKTVHEAKLDLGDYSFKLMINPIRDENGKDLGNSVEWHDMTAIYEEERRVARILESLDCCSTSVMIADADHNIIYMNRSVSTMLKEAESDLRKVMPHFSADDIVGGSMDRFHKDPNHQRSMLERLKDKHPSEITVGRRSFRLTASPILGKTGERIGTVVEWLDRTKEIKAEKEVSALVEASLQGDFTQRVDESDKEGFLLTMTEGLNQLMKTTESGLNEVSNVLLAISEGDLTKRIETQYQGTFEDLKNYCNTTSENLVSVISQIRGASDTISNASSEIAQGNADLSTRTEQQASSLEETASSMEELTSTVRLNAENASQANSLASQASAVAGNGGKLIGEVVTTMASINESAQKIADIIGVIDGIAFQTNILALNAAVEAARAGEQGRGFAVVASEVRTLAQRSANAAKDIKDLISDSVTKVASGNELVNQSGNTMQEIVVAIQRVNDIMSEIAAASAEQASGIDEVSKAVTQMDEMTQQNAALVEEAAAAAESMRSQASDLNQRVGTFKLSNSDVQTKVPQRQPDLLSKQFDELPSVSAAAKPAKPIKSAAPVTTNDDDEWESF
ncbi:methyl-accepting chemotaxis protein [Glaciecola sp. SC05]|uniref:methyl-accepting chemotaxis protein n=1 Tax=Glaciecola sp. SC05 TaxID=1987355 RepID=UPI0035271A22